MFHSFLVAVLSAALVSADSCQNIAGNYYCNPVNKVVYNNVGFSGSYSQVTNFDTSSCSCSQASKSFSGSLSPLDEELSVHFRGPINLKQFAYYSLNSVVNQNQKRDLDDDHDQAGPARVHRHHLHKREPGVVYVTNAVYVTQTVYAGSSSSSSSSSSTGSPVVSSSSTGSPVVSSSSSSSPSSPSSSPSPSTVASSPSPSPSTSSSSTNTPSTFTRTGYYSSSGSSDGLVFLNNMGGAGSGVWDSCFGNSLSYAASDGVSCASSPSILSDTTIASNKEFSIWSNSICQGSSCGYYRPGSVAYHGFGGDTKIFAFEFSMPYDSSSSSSTYNYDMPAVWLLNAQIPRTLQYGNSACSCWSTGCGELDLFEVLNPGNPRLTNHLHSGQNAQKRSNDILPKRAVVGGGGGTPDFIHRPTDSTMKAAAIFQNGTISIVVLPNDTSFDKNLDDSLIANWLGSADSMASVSL